MESSGHVGPLSEAAALCSRRLLTERHYGTAAHRSLTGGSTPANAPRAPTTWCAIGVKHAGLTGPSMVLSGEGPVGDRPRVRQVDLSVVAPAADPTLQRLPLLVLGDGMLRADPPRRLLVAGLLPGGDLIGRGGHPAPGGWRGSPAGRPTRARPHPAGPRPPRRGEGPLARGPRHLRAARRHHRRRHGPGPCSTPPLSPADHSAWRVQPGGQRPGHAVSRGTGARMPPTAQRRWRERAGDRFARTSSPARPTRSGSGERSGNSRPLRE